MYAYADDTARSNVEIPQQCVSGCKTTYGDVLGVSPAGIAAYSNCDSDCVIFEPNRLNEIYTGIKWQCVEYARRWLLKEKGVVFGDVDIAADIWSLEQVTNPLNQHTQKFQSIVNGADELPQKGDLIIYGKDYLGTGHVAVVVVINEEQQTIRVAEQNYDNVKWNKNYAREIKYTSSDNHYWLLDGYLIGWKRVEQLNTH
jgi:glutathionylspermidine amidase/synthetase